MSSHEQDPDSEELDPRVQEELEKLNNCTDEINRYSFSNSQIAK